MIKFGENNKVENIGILEKIEAEAYIHFLEMEWVRHENGIWEAECRQAHPCTEFREILGQFWQSAIRRHKEDIKAIDVLVETLKHRYNL